MDVHGCTAYNIDRVMENLTLTKARKNLADVLNRVTAGERIAVKRPHRPAVHLISDEDYELVREILERAREQQGRKAS